MVHFLDLPDSVIDHIYSKCSLRGRLNLTSTCKELYNYFDREQVWQWSLEGICYKYICSKYTVYVFTLDFVEIFTQILRTNLKKFSRIS